MLSNPCAITVLTELLLYICAPTFLFFFGHCTYKSSHGKALIWSGKVMQIDFSKVVRTMALILVTTCSVQLIKLWRTLRLVLTLILSWQSKGLGMFTACLCCICTI